MNTEKDLTKEQIRDILVEAYRPYWNFVVFLESLRRNNNNTLIESIKSGTFVMFESSEVAWKLIDQEVSHNIGKSGVDALNSKKGKAQLNEMAIKLYKKGEGIVFNTKEEENLFWAYVTIQCIWAISNEIDSSVGSGTTETVDAYMPAFTHLFNKVVPRVFNTYDPEKGSKFTTYLGSRYLFHRSVLQSVRKGLGLSIDERWEPNQNYTVDVDKDKIFDPDIVFYQPGMFDNEGNFNFKDKFTKYIADSSEDEDAEEVDIDYNNPDHLLYAMRLASKLPEMRNVKNKQYKRIITPDQMEKEYPKLIAKDKKSQTREGVKNTYIEDQKLKNPTIGKIDFAIPEGFRKYPPDSSHVYGKWWADYKHIEGVYAKDPVASASLMGLTEFDKNGDTNLNPNEIADTKDTTGKSTAFTHEPKYGETAYKTRLNKIVQLALKGVREPFDRDVMMSLQKANDYNGIYDYISALDIGEDTGESGKGIIYELIGNAIANVLKFKYNLGPLPTGPYDKNKIREYIATAYEPETGEKDGDKLVHANGKESSKMIPKALNWAIFTKEAPTRKNIANKMKKIANFMKDQNVSA